MESRALNKKITNIYITALDSTLNVNSLFMFAVFIGLTWNPTDPKFSLVDDPSCMPSSHVAEDLVSSQVYSFSSFLFSSIISLSLKQALKITIDNDPKTPRSTNPEDYDSVKAQANRIMLRVGIVLVSIGTVCGCGFLMLSIIDMVQFKLGRFSCSSMYSISAVVPLVTFVSSGLLIYISLVLYALRNLFECEHCLCQWLGICSNKPVVS